MKLHYDIIGSDKDACPYLFIHGFGEGRYVWTEVLNKLNVVSPMIFVDLRGHGDSPWSELGHYGIDEYVNDVAELVKTLQLTKFCICGHSLGGRIAYELAMANIPGLERILILDYGFSIGTNHGHAFLESFDQLNVEYSSYQSLVEAFTHARFLVSDAVIERIVPKMSKRLSSSRWVLKVDPKISNPALFESEKNIQGLKCLENRITLAHGEYSSVVNRHVLEKIRLMCPQMDIQLVKEAGHGVVLENPLEIACIIQSHMDHTASDQQQVPIRMIN